MELRSFPSHKYPVSLSFIASDSPPSIPPMEPLP